MQSTARGQTFSPQEQKARRALSTRARPNISASWELRGCVKWAICIQAMRAAPGSRTNAQLSERVHHRAGRAAHRHRSVASGGGEPPPVDVRSEAVIRCLTSGPRVRVVGGGQEQPYTHPLGAPTSQLARANFHLGARKLIGWRAPSDKLA